MSIPIILRRVAQREGIYDLVVHPVLRIPKSTVVRAGEIERAVELAARAVAADSGGILVVLDADDDLPCSLGPDLSRRARGARPDLRVAVVLACREKEAWFLAALESLRGKRRVASDAIPPAEPEAIRDAKGHLFRGYSEITDEPALAALFDLVQAERSRSFRRLVEQMRFLVVQERS